MPEANAYEDGPYPLERAKDLGRFAEPVRGEQQDPDLVPQLQGIRAPVVAAATDMFEEGLERGECGLGVAKLGMAICGLLPAVQDALVAGTDDAGVRNGEFVKGDQGLAEVAAKEERRGVHAAQVEHLTERDYQYGAGELRLRVARVRLDLSRWYNGERMWLEGTEIRWDGTDGKVCNVLARVSALPKAGA